MMSYVNNQYQVLTPNGWKDFEGIQSTTNQGSVRISIGNRFLDCSRNHLVEIEGNVFKKSCDLIEGDVIKTKFGLEKVTHVFVERMTNTEFFDLVEVGGNRTYFTNDISSHNCEFIGSAMTLINPTKLRNMTWKSPQLEMNCLTVFEEPEEDHEYLFICDVARGVGEDYSAFVMVDITEMPYRVVGKYQSKEISPLIYPNVIYNTAKKYNDAYVLIEINDIGGQVADILHGDLEYENIMMSTMKGRAGQQLGAGYGKQTQLGVRTTTQLKRIGCSNLKDLVEKDQLIIQDYDIIEELSNFINNGKGSYEADDGMHDDLVMCLVIFGWAAKQQYLQDMNNINFRKKLYDDNMQMIEDDMLPFGIIDDGPDDDSLMYQEEIERPWGIDEDDINTRLDLF